MTEEQLKRYNRHILLDGFGSEGQERLIAGKVLLVGAGGLGSPCALYLAAAGVGTIGIADADTVSLSNLQRQVIHFNDDEGRMKVDSAKDKMLRINPNVKVETYPVMIDLTNVADIIECYDFIIDCTDSYASKYVVTDACVKVGKPYAAGGVVGYAGQIMTHVPGSMTYRDIFPEEPLPEEVQTSTEIGVLGPAVGIMGSILSAEAIKYLSGTGQLLINKLLTFDTKTMQFQQYVF